MTINVGTISLPMAHNITWDSHGFKHSFSLLIRTFVAVSSSFPKPPRSVKSRLRTAQRRNASWRKMEGFFSQIITGRLNRLFQHQPISTAFRWHNIWGQVLRQQPSIGLSCQADRVRGYGRPKMTKVASLFNSKPHSLLHIASLLQSCTKIDNHV